MRFADSCQGNGGVASSRDWGTSRALPGESCAGFHSAFFRYDELNAYGSIWAFLKAESALKPGHNVFLNHHPARRDLPNDVGFGV